MFDYEYGEFTLGPDESIDLSFLVSNSNLLESTIGFSIWPLHHNYALKELMFSILYGDLLVGDLNGDELLNILDVVLMINIVLNGEYDELADLNNDYSNNILDIVQLVNMIINN